MSVDLGTAWWEYVGIVDGFALLTHYIQHRSRWIDLRTWPAKVGLSLDEWTRSVARARDGRIASLVGWKAQTVMVQDGHGKQRNELKLPFKKYGFRAVGFVGDRVVVIPGHLGHDNHSSPLHRGAAPLVHDGKKFVPLTGGEPGPDPTQSAIVALPGGPDRLVWEGRVFRVDGDSLAAICDLPGTHPNFRSDFVPLDGDRFACAAGGRIAIVDTAVTTKPIGKAQVITVRAYEDALLATTIAPYRHHRFDPGTATHELLDFGTPTDDMPVVFAAPCGLISFAEENKLLVRLRV